VATTGTSGPAAQTGRRERTKARNRAAILGAAREVFAERGYEAATVRDVIRRTGLAAGTFYNYFGDKEAVLRALLDGAVEEARARVRHARATSRTVEGFVGDAYRAYFTFVAEDPATFELMRRNAGTIRALFGHQPVGAGIDELRADLQAAVARGDLPPLDADYMAAAMAGAGLEIGLTMARRDPVDVEGAAAFATDLFMGAIERLGRRPG
jgi:AcrR family transcriptional regulator